MSTHFVSEYFGKKIRNSIAKSKLYYLYLYGSCILIEEFPPIPRYLYGKNIWKALLKSELEDFKRSIDYGYSKSKRFYLHTRNPSYFESLLNIDAYKMHKDDDYVFYDFKRLDFKEFDRLKNQKGFYRDQALNTLCFIRICRLYNLKWRLM